MAASGSNGGMEDLPDFEDLDELLQGHAEPELVEKKANAYAGVSTSGFRDFSLKPEILRAITDKGWEAPSEVQFEAIPQALLGSDLICQGKSGLGKTAVFVISLLQQLDFDQDQTLAVVLGHTRELAFQIQRELEQLSQYITSPAPRIMVFLGGVPVDQHVAMLQKEKPPHIVVGTPGRVMDLVERKALNLSHVRQFVLDECDHLLANVAMRRQVQQVFKATPHKKQVMMFSATIGKDILPIVNKFMQNPVPVIIDEERKLTLDGLKQYKIELTEAEKNRKLVDLLDLLEFNQVAIFVNKGSRARELSALLEEMNFPAIAIYGGLDQAERIKRFKMFKDFEKRLLVSTDLFGRGIDIEKINIVINYDMPTEAVPYLHRVGRAGRFDTRGLAISFIASDEDRKVLAEVQERYKSKIPDLGTTIPDPSSYMNS